MTRALDGGTADPGGRFRFVGRGRESGLLLAAVRHPPAVVLVEGEAGVGKSRLIREAAAVLARNGHQVLTGFCHPLREPLPYGPVVDALRRADLQRAESPLPPTAGALAPLLPDLADRLPPPPSQPLDASAQRFRLVQAVRSLLGALGPTALVVEDLHWVDEATRDLLLLLARDLPPQLSLVLTYRAEDLPPKSAVLGAAYRHPPGTSGTVIRLGPLAEPDIQELAVAAMGPDATAHLGTALYQRSEGLPLVAEEDLITLAEHGRTHGYADAAARLQDADVPRGLSEAVTERLGMLSREAGAVAEAAAVLAVPADEDLLATIARLDAPDGARALIELLQASVLREADDGRYVFRHVLAQQVAYGHIPAPARVRLHRRAVAALQARTPPRLVQIAHHTQAAGDREAWLVRAQDAAEQAVSVGDTGTAATLLHQLLEEPRLAGEQRSRAALALAGIAANGVDFATNARLLRRLLADPQLPVEIRGEIRLAHGLLLLNEADDLAGFREVARAADELRARPERAARALLALAFDERKGVEHGLHWIERAEDTVGDSPDQAVKAAVRASRLTLLTWLADQDVWALAEQLPRHADDPEVVRQTARALHNIADAAIELGHDRRATALMTEAQGLAVRAGSPLVACYARVALLRLAALAGDWEGIDERFDALIDEFPGIAVPHTERALVTGFLAAARGQRAAALEQFGSAAEAGERQLAVSVALRAAAGLGAVHLAQGSPARAWAVAAPAVDLLRRAGTWAKSPGLVPVAVEAALACDERAAAEQLAGEVERAVGGRDSPAAAADLELALGLLAEHAEPDAAVGHYAAAARRWQAIGRPYERARAVERQGVALRGADPAAASALVTEALTAFAELGATADAARCEHGLRELGLARPAPGRRGYGGDLSPREHQVAELLAGGATNQQIADALFLSPRTVEHHVAKVLRKLGTTRKRVGRAYEELRQDH
ncbi:AAA family ATPase [Kitasatospora sp. NPDC049285]|uniref:ATP-binding protein n=1 Tax=Kitasatospora sp. NPDC049285 TaxID=3157096 RepID=UPI00341B7E52